MISYARNGEDAVLGRLFDAPDGYYVDLGAGPPILGSVTKHFSERGWHGLNVDRDAVTHALLCADRPLDRNVHASIGGQPDAPECGTAPVPSLRLADLLPVEGVERIDFLRIDVGGAETAVVDDTDWAVIRPRALVVEAHRSGEPEPALLAAGYVCTLFDGLNRFYAQAGDHDAIAALSVPANVHDDILPFPWLEQVRLLEERVQSELAARTRLEVLGRDLAVAAEEARRLAHQADPGTHLLADRS